MLAAAEHKGLGIPLLAGVCLLCDVRAVLSLQSKQPPLIRVGPREVAQHECPSQILTLRVFAMPALFDGGFSLQSEANQD